jgi:hypothetical protein
MKLLESRAAEPFALIDCVADRAFEILISPLNNASRDHTTAPMMANCE